MGDNRVPLKRGTTFGTYTIDQCVGAGGSGLIYTTQHGCGREMVVKEFFPCDIAVRDSNTGKVIPMACPDRFEKIRDGMEREVRLSGEAGNTTHFVVSAVSRECIYDEEDKLIGVVYPKFSEDSRSLQALIEEWKTNPPVSEYDNYADFARVKFSLTIVNSALNVLDGIHRNSLLHCDISPSNLLWAGTVTLTQLQGSAVFLDFGSAVQTSNGVYEVLEESGRPASTDGFGAPEIRESTSFPISVMPRADIYAMGKILCALVLKDFEPTGQPLRALDDLGNLRVPKYIQVKLREIAEEALQDIPDQRFQRARDMHTKCQLLLEKMESGDLFQEQKNTVKVNRQALWNAGRHWLENSKRPGSRFASLNVVETLMPLADSKRNTTPVFPIQVTAGEDHIETSPVPLMDSFKWTEDSLYLIGQGGIGKTTALIHIMNEAYEKNEYSNTAQIPLFVELSRAPVREGPLYSGSTSTFIRRTIYQQLYTEQKGDDARAGTGELNEAFTCPVEEAVAPLNALFQKATQKPEYILLLDGLNEASRDEVDGYAVVSRLIQEIRWILQNCPNVRVVLTSRSDEEAVYYSELTKLYLSGVEDSEIRAYLHDARMQKTQIDAALENDSLAQTLKIPLYLTIYSMLRQTEDVASQGEIFSIFFSERQEKLEAYTLQNRLAEAEQSRAESSNASQQITALMQSFILDFLLPEIAWSMEKGNVFYLDIEEIEEQIERVLTDTSDTAVCGRYGRRLFQKYRQGNNASAHTQRIARDLLRLADGVDDLTELVVNCCVYSLGILQESNGQYGFMHHHLRDYFAAVKVISSMRLAVYMKEKDNNSEALSCLMLLKDDPLPAEVRRFVGEVLGEHHNAPYYDDEGWHKTVVPEPCRRNLLMRTLSLYRGRFDGEDGYAVYNLMEILKAGRKDLSGEDFSRLDLTGCSLNKVRLGRTGLGASLHGAKIAESTLFPMGHSADIRSFSFSSDGNQMVTASDDGTVKLWDVKTQFNIETLCNMWLNNWNAVFFPVKKQLAIVESTGIRFWDVNTHNYLKPRFKHGSISHIAISPNEEFLLISIRDHTVKVWDIEKNTYISLDGHTDQVHSAMFRFDNKQILTASPRELKLWELASNAIRCVRTWKSPMPMISATYSPDGTQILTVYGELNYGSYAVMLWNATSMEPIGSLKDDDTIHLSNSNISVSDIETAIYSPNGKQIVTTSYSKVKLWDVETQRCTKTLVNTRGVKSAVFSPCGNIVAIQYYDHIQLVDTESGECRNKLDTLASYDINSVVYSPDVSQLAIASADYTVKLWDFAALKYVETLESHSDEVLSIAYKPMEGQLISTSCDTVKRWNTRVGICVDSARLQTWEIRSILSSPDGLHPVLQRFVGNIKICNVKTQNCITLPGCSELVDFVAYYPNLGKIVTASMNGNVRIWSVDTQSCIDTLVEHNDDFISAASHIGSAQIAIFSKHDAVVWNIETKKDVLILSSDNYVHCGAFNSDGTELAIGVSDYIELWNIEEKRRIAKLKKHRSIIVDSCAKTLVYRCDDKELVSTYSDGTAIVWDLNAKAAKYTIHNIPGLIVHNADLSDLNPDSELTDEDKSLLREYGASF